MVINERLDKRFECEAGWEIRADMMNLVAWVASRGMDAETRQVQAPWQLPHLSLGPRSGTQ